MLAGLIDYSLLKPDVTAEEVKQFCQRARKYNVYGVCVSPIWVKDCVRYLKGSNIIIGTVIGFPLGNQTTTVKLAETQQAIKDRAKEIDVVINIGYIKSGWYNKALKELRKIVTLAHRYQVIVKVIIETAYLNRDEIIKTTRLVLKSGADFIKTSTGFASRRGRSARGASSGARINDVRLLKKVVGNRIGIKAAGGINNKIQALALLKAGANRLGVSHIKNILK